MFFESLGQPVINGYLVAGAIVGPGGLQLIKELVQVGGIGQQHSALLPLPTCMQPTERLPGFKPMTKTSIQGCCALCCMGLHVSATKAPFMTAPCVRLQGYIDKTTQGRQYHGGLSWLSCV